MLLEQNRPRGNSQCHIINESPSRRLNYYNDSLLKQWRNYKLSKPRISQQRENAVHKYSSKIRNVCIEKTIGSSLSNSTVQSPIKHEI